MYTVLLGRSEKVDYHGNDSVHDYKTRLERQYEENFHRALQDDVGYNAADVKSFRMEMDGTSSQYLKLYETAKKYAAYLKLKSGILSRAQADKSLRANLNIEELTLGEIKRLSTLC